MKKRLLSLLFATQVLFANRVDAPGLVKTHQLTYLKNPSIKLYPQEAIYRTDEIKRWEQDVKDFQNYKTTSFERDSPIRLLARMLLGEAAGCSQVEKVAIAYTAINRTKWNNQSLEEVILAPRQYSCFNPGTDSNIFLKNPLRYDKTEFLECLTLAEDILQGEYKDPTNGATHYYDPKGVKEIPYWAKSLKKIGRLQIDKNKWTHHIFFKGR
jgi:N-acetylmuramoyl-L-alanine amidase